MIFKMVIEIKFCTPKPDADLCMRVDLPLDKKIALYPQLFSTGECFLFQLLNLPQKSPTRVVSGSWAWGCSLEISRMSWGGHVFDKTTISSKC